MKKQSKIITTMMVLLLAACLHAQELKLAEKHLSVGEDARFSATGFKSGNLIWISSDISPFQFKIPANRMDKDSRGNYRGSILTNQYFLPGLYSHSAKYTAKQEDSTHPDTLSLIDTSFLFIPSPGRSQQTFPDRDNSVLPFTITPGSKQIRDSLQQLRDSVRIAFNKMENIIAYKTGVNGEITKYNIDSSFYDRIDSVAHTWANSLDSGRVVEAGFIINFSHGITLVNWKSEHANADSVLKIARSYFDSLLNFVQAVWKADGVITDTASVGRKLWFWAENEHKNTLPDNMCYFRRTDRQIVSILLDRYSSAFGKKKRRIWLGFAHDKNLEQFLILFSVTGKKKSK